jgi:hypothetical protein
VKVPPIKRKGCRAQNRAADLDAIGGAPKRRGMANILATATFSIRAKSDKRLKRLIGLCMHTSKRRKSTPYRHLASSPDLAKGKI